MATVQAQSLPAIRNDRFSSFSRNEKRYIVFLIASAGWFSTLSSFIYYPVISLVATDLSTTIAKVNLTVTSYLVISGVTPAFVGDAADILGRRPLYIITLSIYVVANMGIALQGSFVALLLLRMLQSAGISGTFSIAYGVIGDISTPAERGSYVAGLSLGITTAPSLGPLLGGAIGSSIGWRWIFWFLCIASGLCLSAMVLTLPETARSLVVDGSVPPPKWSKLPIPRLYNLPRCRPEAQTQPSRDRMQIPNPMKSLLILTRKDNLCLVVAGGITYTIYCCLNASLSSLFIETYKLNQLQAGFIYLPFGIGCMLSTLMSGKIIDRDYRIVAKRYGIPVEKNKGDDLARFPVEEARTRSSFLPLGVAMVAIVGFGWVLQVQTHIAIPLILQFLAGLSMQLCFNINNTLLVDINQEAPSAAQASSNIIRCALSALAVAFLQDIVDGIGKGWTFTFLGLLMLAPIGLNIIIRKKGMAWRVRQRGSASETSANIEAGESDLKILRTSTTLQSGENTAAT